MLTKSAAFRRNPGEYLPVLRAVHAAMNDGFIERQLCHRVIRGSVVRPSFAPSVRAGSISHSLCEGGLLQIVRVNGDIGFSLTARACQELGLPEPEGEPTFAHGGNGAEFSLAELTADAVVSFETLLAPLTDEDRAWLYSGVGLVYVYDCVHGPRSTPSLFLQELRVWRDQKIATILAGLPVETRQQVVSGRFINLLYRLRSQSQDKEWWWTF